VTFTFEQFMQIMALACEKPEAAERPVSSWTPRELADEAVKRGIVTKISPRTVERFLNRQGKGCVGSSVVKYRKRKESTRGKEKVHETRQNVCKRNATLVSSGRA
jgi:hypothetical protein